MRAFRGGWRSSLQVLLAEIEKQITLFGARLDHRDPLGSLLGYVFSLGFRQAASPRT